MYGEHQPEPWFEMMHENDERVIMPVCREQEGAEGAELLPTEDRFMRLADMEAFVQDAEEAAMKENADEEPADSDEEDSEEEECEFLTRWRNSSLRK